MQDSRATVPATIVDGVVTEEVIIELDRCATTVTYCPGNTLLQTARMAGLNPRRRAKSVTAERAWRA